MSANYKRLKNRMVICWWVANLTHHAADKQVLEDVFVDCHVYLFSTQSREHNARVKPKFVKTKLKPNCVIELHNTGSTPVNANKNQAQMYRSYQNHVSAII